jgi:hypothetical protein
VVHRLGQTTLEDLGLQSSLHEILGLQGQDVIESHTGVIQHTDSDQSSDQGVTLEESLGVLVVELEQFSGGSSDLWNVLSIACRVDSPSQLTLDKVN